MRAFAAVDGGGTKTDFALISESGDVLARRRLGGSNPNVLGTETACGVLRRGVAEVVRAAACGAPAGAECPEAVSPVLAGVYAGIAGAMSGDNGTRLAESLSKAFPGVPVRVETDIRNVIEAAGQTGPCVAAILGTGSVAYFFDGESMFRTGGWGYLFDSAGSGYDIGRDVLRECLAKGDGFRGASPLTELAERRLGGTAWEHIAELYAEGRDFIASFAPVAFEAFREGDPSAAEILRRSCDRIAELVRHAARGREDAASGGLPVVLAGGLTRERSFFGPGLEKRLGPGYRLVFSDRPPIDGACRRALGLFAD